MLRNKSLKSQQNPHHGIFSQNEDIGKNTSNKLLIFITHGISSGLDYDDSNKICETTD